MFSSNTSNSTHLFVRSNIHMANLDTALKKHLHLQKFVDVTLSCEGRTFKCHRLILAAASPLFESLFIDNPSQHPIVIIPLGIKAWTIQALIDFMYKGHINVSQCGIRELVRSAESLQISGLNSARKDLAKYYQRVDVSKEVEEANEHKKLRWKKCEQGGHSMATSHHDTERGDNCDELEYLLHQRQQQQQRDDGNDIRNDDDNDDYDDEVDNCENLENTIASVDDADEAAHGLSHHDLSDVSYRFEIAAKNYVATKRRTNSKQTKNTPMATASDRVNSYYANMEYSDRQDAECMFSEDHNDSGLPASPPTTAVSKTKTAVKVTESSVGAVGRIRVKSGIKLFDKINKKLRMDKIPQLRRSSIESNLSSHEKQIEIDNLEDLTTTTKAHNFLGSNFRYDSNTDTPLLPCQVKAEQINLEFERIVCQPNVSYICSTENVENINDADLINQKVQDAHEFTQYNNKNVPGLLKAMLSNDDSAEVYAGKYVDTDAFNSSDHIDVVGQSLKRNKKLSKLYYNTYTTRKTTKTTSTAPFSILPNMNYNGISCGKEQPSLQTVMLRSPRSNQPRSYSNEALYNALMAVKHGESIYRASREYQVPRKTLRNWMKRWDIKSQYPMPKQLKDAATKRKLSENVE